MKNNDYQKQMNVCEIILYHLLPGVPILLLAIFFANPTWGLDMPIVLAIMFAIMIGLVPVQLSIIFLTAKHQGKSFKEVISFTDKTPLKKMVLLIVLCFLISGFVFVFLSGFEHLLWTDFSLMPDWLRLDKTDMNSYSTEIFRITVVMYLVFNVLLGPITEEIYFRGFLLPRMGKLGKSAPIVNAVLFSVYHFFSPWEIITRILGTMPYIYFVWRKKDIRIGIVVHCLTNTLGFVGMMAAVLAL